MAMKEIQNVDGVTGQHQNHITSSQYSEKANQLLKGLLYKE